MAGKTEVPTGKWEIFFGIGPGGWFNKGDLTNIKGHYGNDDLFKIADALDAKLGDPRSYEYVLATIGRTSQPTCAGGFVGGSNFSYIDKSTVNSGLRYAPTDDISGMKQNYNDIVSYLNSLH